jgi:hypothetical protein
MAASPTERSWCVLEFVADQRTFRRQFRRRGPPETSIQRWYSLQKMYLSSSFAKHSDNLYAFCIIVCILQYCRGSKTWKISYSEKRISLEQINPVANKKRHTHSNRCDNLKHSQIVIKTVPWNVVKIFGCKSEGKRQRGTYVYAWYEDHVNILFLVRIGVTSLLRHENKFQSWICSI